MSYTIDEGFTRGNNKNLVIFDVDHTQWAKTSETLTKNGKRAQAIFTNTASSSNDRVQTLSIAVTRLDDVYKNTGITADVQAPFKKGAKVVVNLRGTYKATDADSGKVYYLPVESSVSYTIPLHEALTDAYIEKNVRDIISECYPEGSVADSVIAAWAKGILRP